MSSAIALGKMGYMESIPVLIDLLFTENISVSKRVYTQLSKFDVRIYRKIAKMVETIVEEKIAELLEEAEHVPLNTFPKEALMDLKWFYRLVEEYEEVEFIDNIIKSNNN